MKKNLLTIATIVTSIGSLSAATTTNLVFNNLNSDLTTANSLDVGGSNAGLSVTGAASGLDFVYSVTLNGQDFDGDSVNDILTFDVVVSGLTGSVETFGTAGGDNTNSSVVLGTTATQVILNNAASAPDSFNPVTVARFDDSQTLQFSLTSFSVALSSGALGTAASTGFTQVFFDEGGGTNHQAIIGEGTGLTGIRFNGNRTQNLTGTGDLFITASSAGGNNNRLFSVTDVDFGIVVDVADVVPEPSSSLLMALSGFSLILRRRR